MMLRFVLRSEAKVARCAPRCRGYRHSCRSSA